MSSYAEQVASLTSEDILSKFTDVIPLKHTTGAPSSAGSDENSAEFHGHDAEQIKLMNELCIVLDNNDTAIGAGTKKACHLMTNINAGLLHRAFSVFLFNTEGKLLLQQRADEKITFPDLWTNTCCSHPLCVSDELGKSEELADKVEGAIVAARRKLEHELGIPVEQTKRENFTFLNRIHYMAPSNEPWGEHEIDYILFYKTKQGESIDLSNLNVNEIKDAKYVSQEELKAMFNDGVSKFTPWFKLICEKYLFQWWAKLDTIEECANDQEISRML